MNDDHSEVSELSPSSLISGFSTDDSSAKVRFREHVGRVEGRRVGARKCLSGEIERCDGRTAESNDVERTFENKSPSSPTSSPLIPAHSTLLLLSIGVPRPMYFINGQNPRGTELPGNGESLDTHLIFRNLSPVVVVETARRQQGRVGGMDDHMVKTCDVRGWWCVCSRCS
jgi:hypothetical protein